MKATNKARYAVRAMFDLAYFGRQQPQHVRAISRRQDIPHRFLEQIFQVLKREGLVRSRRGPKGGYLLMRPLEEVSIGDIIVAIEGPTVLEVESDVPSTQSVPVNAMCRLACALDETLRSVTLEMLCVDARAAQLEDTPTQAAYTYTI